MFTVLIVSYNFPPVGGAGVQRPVKFVKYLREYGWEPLVLTVANPSVPVIDKTLEKDIPAGVQILKATTYEPSYQQKQGFKNTQSNVSGSLKKIFKKIIFQFLLPDLQVLWWPGLVMTLIKAIKTDRPDCLFVTAPPFSSFVPVVALGRIFGIPVVLDYRDEWSFSRNTWENSNKSWFASFVDSVMERFVISQCAAFTAANASYVDSLNKTYPHSTIGKGTVITNGYDDDDFEIMDAGSTKKDDFKITLVYTGTVWAATSFQPIITALQSLLAKLPELETRISLKIVGRVVDNEALLFESNPIKKIVTLCGYLDHDRVIEELNSADVLLLTLSDLPGAEKIITGKAFEYMASGKHVFAIVPEGETKDLFCSNYDNVTIANPSDIPSIISGFKMIIEHIDDIRIKRGKATPQFLRRNLTAKLAEVFDTVTGKKPL
jgi:glycosyltransferase involved in cell wall biosynthesis